MPKLPFFEIGFLRFKSKRKWFENCIPRIHNNLTPSFLALMVFLYYLAPLFGANYTYSGLPNSYDFSTTVLHRHPAKWHR